MKKLLCSLLVSICLITSLFAATFKVTVKGEVYLKTAEGDMVQLNEEDSITDEDTIIVGDKATVSFYIGDQKILIRKAGVYKIADIVKGK